MGGVRGGGGSRRGSRTWRCRASLTIPRDPSLSPRPGLALPRNQEEYAATMAADRVGGGQSRAAQRKAMGKSGSNKAALRRI
jgi:hypothetical protein